MTAYWAASRTRCPAIVQSLPPRSEPRLHVAPGACAHGVRAQDKVVIMRKAEPSTNSASGWASNSMAALSVGNIRSRSWKHLDISSGHFDKHLRVRLTALVKHGTNARRGQDQRPKPNHPVWPTPKPTNSQLWNSPCTRLAPIESGRPRSIHEWQR
jgi:hypothetical protein